MICDHVLFIGECKNTPTRAPRLVVPAKDSFLFGHKALKIFTALHYCELHKGQVKAQDLLTPKVKGWFEEAAKRKRPAEFRLDFEGAFVEYVLTTTPEYRRFVSSLRQSGELMRIAMGTRRLAA